MKKVLCLLSCVSFLLTLSIQPSKSEDSKGDVQGSDTNIQKDVKESSNIIIKGTITNAKNLKPYFEEDAFLQLLPNCIDGKMSLNIKIENGKLIIISDGPQSNISKSGSFSFMTDKLAPGTYCIIINNLTDAVNRLADERVKQCIFLSKNKERFKFDIKDTIELSSPSELDLGELVVLIPGVE